MSVFEEIKIGLQQAIEYESGVLHAKSTKLSVLPPDTFTAQEIKAIRVGTGLTQATFAKFMGVSVKTVEAWESGRNHPEGAACRLLAITKEYPSFPRSSGIVTLA